MRINTTKIPKVAVIMPVYNAEAYLRKAIDSILNQTFSDFEFIIIDDCSTDDSEQIIRSYTDPRIKYVKLHQKSGVVSAMNTGLQTASAPFVAVMHADDISMPDRLQKQVDYLQAHPEVDVVAGFIININEQGEILPEWKMDRTCITAAQIRAGMIQRNCIAHSAVMMRTEIVKKYGYSSSAKHKGFAVEDYPLWLHLLADNHAIEKIPEAVLYYRLHTHSATGVFLKNKNPFWVDYYSKNFFLEQRKQAGKQAAFDKKIQASMYRDYTMGLLKETKKKVITFNYKCYLQKRRVEDIFIFPFILIGRAIALFKPLREEYDIFFFFPFYTIGGAEKVHLQVALTVTNKRAILFFTRKSTNDLLLKDFQQTGHMIRDISRYTDNKWLYFNNLIFRGIVTGYIKTQKKRPVVFNGQCNFGYKISPWLPASILQIELIHSFCSFSYIRIPFIPFYKKTVMISRKSIEDHIALYDRLNVPAEYANRIEYIPNGISLPAERIDKNLNKQKYTLLYAGRGTFEKRVHIIASLAERCSKTLPVIFEFMGDVKDAIPVSLHPYCHFHGNQHDDKIIDHIYRNADFLIITSNTEGFPLVIMEAMARGLMIIATAVGDIPRHVQQQNGFVINEIKDEHQIIEQAYLWLKEIIEQPEKMEEISAANIIYAKQHFDIKKFEQAYTHLFN